MRTHEKELASSPAFRCSMADTNTWEAPGRNRIQGGGCTNMLI